MKQQNFRKSNLFIVFVITLSLTISCSPKSYNDLVSLNTSVIEMDKQGYYYHVAWLSDNMIVAPYAPELGSNLDEFIFYIYDLTTQKWEIFTPPKPKECFSGDASYPNRLPSGRLGYAYKCFSYDGNASGLLLVQSDVGKNFTTFEIFKPPFHPVDFTFSVDMSKALQQRANDKTFLSAPPSPPRQILPKFYAVVTPRWSPDNSQIAFGGIESASPTSDAEYFLTPYDIYLMTPDFENVQPILSGVRFLQYLKWSPGGQWLSFRGEYEGQEGIWLLNIQSKSVTRLWPQQDFYDWSPDGKQMVILKKTKVDNDVTKTELVIVDLSAEFQDPPK